MSKEKHISTSFPISSLFPNMVTIVSLCFGMSSIKYALDGRWELSVGLLVISAFLDGMDGRLARFLNASSRFGAELDSLADFINFGIAPAFILYLWSMVNIPIKGLGWAIAMIYSICMALRLARFNAFLSKETTEKDKNYFFGIPAPSAAGLTLLPIMLSFTLEINIFKDNPIYVAGYLLIIAFMATSRIPTFSLKNSKIHHHWMIPMLIFAAILIIALITKPWLTLPVVGAIYIAVIPISVISYYRK
jgi:CDP-diacylglycerol--serine O-phosphatidyltransferase